MIPETVVQWLGEITGETPLPSTARPVSGGCINEAKLIRTGEGNLLFLKENSVDNATLFEAESACLELLASTNSIRVPRPFGTRSLAGRAWLAMEGICLTTRQEEKAQRRMGRSLAELHRYTHRAFGCAFENFIGATPQPNGWCDSWADFFVERRLQHQFRLAEQRGRTFAGEEDLLHAVHSHIDSLAIRPALLHGDLWGGNAAFAENGEPVLFDPASYYGDREADIAFTGVFGGFGPAFYEAYRETHEAPEAIRETIYNLYHILNHFVLFGGGYGDQAERMITGILRTLQEKP